MLNEHASPQLLGVVRIVVFGFWLANVSQVHLEDLAALPLELLSRYGALWLIPRPVWGWMWTAPFLLALKAALVACLCWSILGLPRFRSVAILTCVLLVLFDGMEKSLGHINHSKFAMLYAAFVLAAFPSADAISLAPRRAAPAEPVLYAAPVVAISLLILVPYSLIAASRLGRSGPAVFFGDAIGGWFLRRSYEANSTEFRFGIVVAQSATLLALSKLGFAITTALELLSPLCLVSRWFRRLWVPGMIGFHFTSLLTMNIFFWQNVLLILMVVTDCDRLFASRLTASTAPTLFYRGRRAARVARGARACDPFSVLRTEPLGSEASLQRLGRLDQGGTRLILQDEQGEHPDDEALRRIASQLGGLWRPLALALPARAIELGFWAVAWLSPTADRRCSRDVSMPS